MSTAYTSPTAAHPVVYPSAGPPIWYWRLGDAPGHGSCVRSLLDGHGAGYPSAQRALIRLVKKGCDTALPDGTSFASLVYCRLLAALSEDKVSANAHHWAVYPGHTGQANMLPVLSRYLGVSGPLSNQGYLPHLFLRHRPAMKAAYARRDHTPVTFTNQTDTVCLNHEHRQALRGKRILVLDDFCTQGYSFEWARLLLMQAGASGMVCVSLCRCGSVYHQQQLVRNQDWDPFHPVRFGDSDLSAQTVTVAPHPAALHPFRLALQSRLTAAPSALALD